MSPRPEPANLVLPTGSTAQLVVHDLPPDPAVTAVIEPDGAPFVIEHVVVQQQVLKPLGDADVERLKPFPPSIRDRARKVGSLAIDEIARSDGVTPVALPGGAEVVVAVHAVAADTIGGTTLVVTGSEFGRVEVPVVVVNGTPALRATYGPAFVSGAVEPGASMLPQVISVRDVPAAGTAVATLNGSGEHVRIASVIAYEVTRAEYTEEELELYPRSERDRKRREGYPVQREVARVEKGAAIEVPWVGALEVTLDIAPGPGAPSEVQDLLVIHSTAWQRIEVPVQIAVSGLSMSFPTDAVAMVQGMASELVDLVLTSRAVVAADVRLQLDPLGDPFLVHPEHVHLPAGETVTVPVRFTIDSGLHVSYPPYLGTYPVELAASAFAGRLERRHPLRLTVTPGTVDVSASQSAVLRQGDRGTCPVQVRVSGGYKKLTFDAVLLPAGVRMPTVVHEAAGPSTTVAVLEFTTDPDALPVTAETATIRWTASDGIHAGILQVPVTVLLRPESRTFAQPVVTPSGIPLGGRVEMVLGNDGGGRFTGSMRATGFLSYDFRVRSVIRSATGSIAVMAQKSGSVYGTDTPGDRQFDWNDPVSSPFVGALWPDVRTANMAVTRASELSGVVGGLSDVAVDLAGFVVSANLLGAVVSGGRTLAGIAFVGSELAELTDVRIVGPGGLPGLVLAGGAAFLFGGAVLLPVLVGGIVIGDINVLHRPMSDAERSFAAAVFGDTLPVDRIVITNLTGAGGVEFVVPNLDGSILVNMGGGFGDPIEHRAPTRGYGERGELFVHELTHAWQMGHSERAIDYFWRAALAKIDDNAYRYGPPGPPWSSFGLEAQASLVCEWFAGVQTRAAMPIVGRRSLTMPSAPASGMRVDDPYFGYIGNNVRLGEP